MNGRAMHCGRVGIAIETLNFSAPDALLDLDCSYSVTCAVSLGTLHM